MMSIGRASVLIGAGTVVSRATGLLRSIVLVSAVGAVSMSADAFTVANQLPNAIYLIVSMGVLTGVIVPQIVAASQAEDGGTAYISKLITLGAVVLLAITAIAVAAAPFLVQLYSHFDGEQAALATTFAYWCLPQIFFYGMYALLGETLNARRVFGPYTWAPIVNNVISIIGFGAFIVLYGPAQTGLDWTLGMVALIAGTATLGIIVQCIVLVVFWRRTGLHLRPDFRWRGMGLGVIGRLASWTFLMVLVGQLSAIVQSRVLSEASAQGAAANMVNGNANLIFMLPYSIIVLSIGIPYFTQLSEHAAAGRRDDMRTDISTSIRSIGVLIVVAAVALAAAAVPVSRIFTDDAATAVDAGLVLLGYLVGLIPIAVLFTIQRSFYAVGDTRTPFIFSTVQAVVVVGTALAAALLPAHLTAAGVALGQSIAILVAVILAGFLLHHRLGGIGASSWLPAMGRFLLAAVPAGAAGWGVFLLMGGASGWAASDKLLAAVATIVICLVTAVVYAGALFVLRAPELKTAIGMARRFLPGGGR